MSEDKKIGDNIGFLETHNASELFVRILELGIPQYTTKIINILTSILTDDVETQEYVLSILNFDDLYAMINAVHADINRGQPKFIEFDLDFILAFSRLIYTFSRNFNDSLIDAAVSAFRISADAFIVYNVSSSQAFFLFAMFILIEKKPDIFVELFNECVNIEVLCNCVESSNSDTRCGALNLIRSCLNHDCSIEMFDFDKLKSRFEYGGDPNYRAFEAACRCFCVYILKHPVDSEYLHEINTIFDNIYQEGDFQYQQASLRSILYLMSSIESLNYSQLTECFTFFAWFERCESFDEKIIINLVLTLLFNVFKRASTEGYLDQCKAAFFAVNGNDIVDEIEELSDEKSLLDQIEDFRSYYFAS